MNIKQKKNQRDSCKKKYKYYRGLIQKIQYLTNKGPKKKIEEGKQ